MKIMKSLLVAIVIVLVALPASASVSLSGITGTGNLPTADIVKGGSAAFDSIGGNGTTQAYRAAFGLSPNWEISAMYDSANWDTKGGAVKYLIPGLGKTAVGVSYQQTALSFNHDLGEELNLVGETIGSSATQKIWQGYLVHTLPLVREGGNRPGLYASVGLNYTHLATEYPHVTFRDQLGRGFASLEAKTGPLSIAADYMTRNTVFEPNATTSIVMRYNGPLGIGFEAGWSNAFLNTLGYPASNFFFGASYQFGVK